MLQIIGWLGCAYLLVKGFELISANRNTMSYVGAGLAWLFAVLFFFMFQAQVGSSPLDSISSGSTGYEEPMVEDPMTNPEYDMNAME